MRSYSSFEDIDKDLKILRLQTKIDMEEMKLSLDQTKGQVSPMSLVGSMVGSLIQKAVVLKAVTKIFGINNLSNSDRK